MLLKKLEMRIAMRKRRPKRTETNLHPGIATTTIQGSAGCL